MAIKKILQNVDKSLNREYLLDIRNSLIVWMHHSKGLNNQQIGVIFNLQRSTIGKILKKKDSKNPKLWITFKS